MKRFFIIIIALVVAGLGLSCKRTEAAEPKAKAQYPKAPDFTLVSIKGDTVRLSDFQGKVVIIDFWATWCPPCREEIPDFVDLYSAKRDEGLEIIGIAVGEKPSSVKAFASDHNMNYHVLLSNGQVEKAYGGINAIPTTFILGKDLTIRQKVIGYRPGNFFKAQVETLLREE